nr:hypothetical protein CPBEC2_30920 [Clostridium perfringens]
MDYMDELFKKYGIQKEYKTIKNRMGFPLGYAVNYKSSNNAIKFKANMVTPNYCDFSINGILATNFNKKYLDDNKIEFKEDKNKIIPLGLIECYSTLFIKQTFAIIFSSIEEIYNSKEIIENFERALYLRCEALEFIDNFEINIFE